MGVYLDHPLAGYRRLTYMLMDADIVAVSTSRVHRALSQAGLLGRWSRKASKKGSGFMKTDLDTEGGASENVVGGRNPPQADQRATPCLPKTPGSGAGPQ